MVALASNGYKGADDILERTKVIRHHAAAWVSCSDGRDDDSNPSGVDDDDDGILFTSVIVIATAAATTAPTAATV